MAGPRAADLIRRLNVITSVLIRGAAAAGGGRSLGPGRFPADEASLLLPFTANATWVLSPFRRIPWSEMNIWAKMDFYICVQSLSRVCFSLKA